MSTQVRFHIRLRLALGWAAGKIPGNDVTVGENNISTSFSGLFLLNWVGAGGGGGNSKEKSPGNEVDDIWNIFQIWHKAFGHMFCKQRMHSSSLFA